MPTFDITPEKEASTSQFFYRQFFLTPPPLGINEADLTGKVAIVTGPTAGIGLETARQLLDLNCNLILAVRDEKRGQKAKENLLAGRTPSRNTGSVPDIDIWELDLGSYDCIMAFADKAKTLERLDYAILNAGIYKVFEQFDPVSGYETTVQINYFANMLLMTLLIPVLKEKRQTNGPPGRLVLVNSDTSSWSKFPERSEALSLPSSPSPLKGADKDKTFLSFYKHPMPKWDMQERYGVSKLLGQFYLTELVKRVPPSAAIITAANPGMCYGSSIDRDGPGSMAAFIWKTVSRIFGRSCAVGARTFVHAVAREEYGSEDCHGQYFEDARLRPMAAIVYKPEGIKIAKMVWEETLEELKFAGIGDIVEELAKTK